MEDNSISTLSKAYASRIKIEKLKQEKGQKKIDINNSIKFQNLLEAMLNVRDGLKELLVIDLGKRFSLDLIENDYLGFPSFNLYLKDNENEIKETPSFVARANDYNEEVTIEFIILGSLQTLKIENHAVVTQIPSYLRKNLRGFLDAVTLFAVENEIKSLELPAIDFQTEDNNLSDNISDEDLIENKEDLPDFDTLPILEEIELI